jgi:hypothetical protein
MPMKTGAPSASLGTTTDAPPGPNAKPAGGAAAAPAPVLEAVRGASDRVEPFRRANLVPTMQERTFAGKRRNLAADWDVTAPPYAERSR